MTKRISFYVSVVLAILLAVAAGLCLFFGLRASALSKRTEALLYQKGYALSEQLNTTRVHLAQLSVLDGCDAVQEKELRDRVYHSASLAVEALSSLPLSHEVLGRVLTFLNRVADYCRNADGFDSADELYDTCTKLSAELDVFLLSSPSLTEQLLSADAPAIEGADELFTIPDNAYPRLIYDGPFSESAVKPDSELLASLPEADETAVRKKWAEVLGDEELLSVQKVDSEHIDYYFLQGERATAGFTLRGAVPWWLHRLSDGDEVNLSAEQCLAAAEEALKRAGREDMRCVYTQKGDTGYTFNFARSLNGVTVYAELIKVGISHFNGDVLLWEATAFLSSYKQDRTVPDPVLTNEEALARLPVSAEEVTPLGLALVPAEKWGDNDTLCYEFTYRRNGLECFCYVNAADGSIFDVLIVRPDGVEGGKG